MNAEVKLCENSKKKLIGGGTGLIWGIRVDVNEEVTFFCDLFLFFGGRGWESDQMFGWGRGGVR